MLQWLRLRDFVIVESAEIEFGPGFTVLTGETGAGKSILLDAMGLVLGGRGDATLVREGAERADISALFGIDDTLAAWLAEHDLAGDPGQLLLRRIVEKDGRSRAQINGHPSTIARLRELGEQLVDIHGQHESQHLLRPGAQRELLDRLAGQERLLADGWQRWQQASRALEAARSGSREEAIRIERLQWEIDELTQLRLAPGEWEALSAEQQRLAHAHDLLAGADALANALERDEDAIAGRLGSLQGRLRALAEIDPALKNAAELVDSAVIQIDEAASELAAYADRVDLDPERFAEVEQRVAALFNTARKLRLQPQDLASHLEGLQAELEQLGAAVDIEKLEAASAEAEAAYRKLAEKVSAARKKTAADCLHASPARAIGHRRGGVPDCRTRGGHAPPYRPGGLGRGALPHRTGHCGAGGPFSPGVNPDLRRGRYRCGRRGGGRHRRADAAAGGRVTGPVRDAPAAGGSTRRPSPEGAEDALGAFGLQPGGTAGRGRPAGRDRADAGRQEDHRHDPGPCGRAAGGQPALITAAARTLPRPPAG